MNRVTTYVLKQDAKKVKKILDEFRCHNLKHKNILLEADLNGYVSQQRANEGNYMPVVV